MPTKAITRQWHMTVEWPEGGKYNGGWSRSLSGDITIPDDVTTEEVRDYLFAEVTKDEEPGGEIVRFELDGKGMSDET